MPSEEYSSSNGMWRFSTRAERRRRVGGVDVSGNVSPPLGAWMTDPVGGRIARPYTHVVVRCNGNFEPDGLLPFFHHCKYGGRDQGRCARTTPRRTPLYSAHPRRPRPRPRKRPRWTTTTTTPPSPSRRSSSPAT